MYELKDCKKYRESCFVFENHNLSKRNDAIVQAFVEDPVNDDRIPAETGMIPAPCELSEFEKMKHAHTSHSNHGAHRASKAKHRLSHTNELSVSLKTANFPLFSVTTLFLKICCSLALFTHHQWNEQTRSFDSCATICCRLERSEARASAARYDGGAPCAAVP